MSDTESLLEGLYTSLLDERDRLRAELAEQEAGHEVERTMLRNAAAELAELRTAAQDVVDAIDGNLGPLDALDELLERGKP